MPALKRLHTIEVGKHVDIFLIEKITSALKEVKQDLKVNK